MSKPKKSINKKSAEEDYSLPKTFWVIVVIIFVLTVASIGYYAYWRTGWPAYRQALRKCGEHLPVEANSWSDHYITPDDDRYRVPGEGYRTYFCTEDEAKAQGYTELENPRTNSNEQ